MIRTPQIHTPGAFIALAAFALVLASGIAAQEPIGISIRDDLTDGAGPACGPRIAASGPEELTVGWCVEQGPSEGVWLRHRSQSLWSPSPFRIASGSARAPRDLDIHVNAAGMTRAVWTAMDSGRRRVFYAEAERGNVLAAPVILNLGDDWGADYPFLSVNEDNEDVDDDLVHVIWQSSRDTHFAIDVVLLDPAGGAVVRLPSISGASSAALTPHLVASRPLIVAWYEILEPSNALHMSALVPEVSAWTDLETSTLLPAAALGAQPFVLQQSDTLDLYAYWSQLDDSGQTTVRAVPLDGAQIGWTFSSPPGDHSQPEFADAGPGRLTAVWQRFADGAQDIRIAIIDIEADAEPVAILISPAGHRFASSPRHVTRGLWSAAAWHDDPRDGGSGEVGFADIDWPSVSIAPPAQN